MLLFLFYRHHFIAFTFRLAMVKRPSYYKNTITKVRLHIAHVISCSFLTIEIAGVFILFRNDLKDIEMCNTPTILHPAVLYTLFLLNFVLVTLLMSANTIWVTVALTTRKRNINCIFNSNETDLKLTRTMLIILCVYIRLYSPTVVLVFIMNVVEKKHNLIAADVCFLLFFTANVVNPFIYYATLKDFKQAYKNILLCRRSEEEEQNQQIELAVVEL